MGRPQLIDYKSEDDIVNYDELVRKLSPPTKRLATSLHETVLRHGCALRIDEEEDKATLV